MVHCLFEIPQKLTLRGLDTSSLFGGEGRLNLLSIQGGRGDAHIFFALYSSKSQAWSPDSKSGWESRVTEISLLGVAAAGSRATAI